MYKQPDRDVTFMLSEHGTNRLVTDYGALDSKKKTDGNEKVLREIAHDDLNPKKHDFRKQNEIHEKIRNDKDYDDWEYGTEPIFG